MKWLPIHIPLLLDPIWGEWQKGKSYSRQRDLWSGVRSKGCPHAGYYSSQGDTNQRYEASVNRVIFVYEVWACFMGLHSHRCNVMVVSQGILSRRWASRFEGRLLNGDSTSYKGDIFCIFRVYFCIIFSSQKLLLLQKMLEIATFRKLF